MDELRSDDEWVQEALDCFDVSEVDRMSKAVSDIEELVRNLKPDAQYYDTLQEVLAVAYAGIRTGK